MFNSWKSTVCSSNECFEAYRKWKDKIRKEEDLNSKFGVLIFKVVRFSVKMNGEYLASHLSINL